jgi:hypothetical protein
MPSDSYSTLFVVLAFGFAIATIVLAWSSADHDRRDVVLAAKDRAEKRNQVKALELRLLQLEAEYPKTYMRYRKRGEIVIEKTKDRLQLYRRTFLANCRYPDSNVDLPPSLKLPKDLESDEPPAVPKSRKEADEEKEEGGDEQ